MPSFCSKIFKYFLQYLKFLYFLLFNLRASPLTHELNGLDVDYQNNRLTSFVGQPSLVQPIRLGLYEAGWPVYPALPKRIQKKLSITSLVEQRAYINLKFFDMFEELTASIAFP